VYFVYIYNRVYLHKGREALSSRNGAGDWSFGITCCSSQFGSVQVTSDYKGDKHATQTHKARTRPP
jgi:hypothetical protein